MTAVPSAATGWRQIGHQTQLPPGAQYGVKAQTQVGLGQACYFSTDNSGNVVMNDGTVPGLTVAGVGDEEMSPQIAPTVDGAGGVRVWEGLGSGQMGSTLANDAITAASFVVPVFDAGNGVAGLLSNAGGNDRSFLGMAFGLAEDGSPIVWSGRLAGAVARMLHAINGESVGLWSYAADATATTAQGTGTGGPPPTALATIGFVIPRPKRRSIIQSVEIVPSAALAATGATNYRVIQLWKVDTTGGVALASSPLVATFTTATQALVAGQPTAFSLTSTVLLRETDVLVGTSIVNSGGATVPQSFIRANAKVI